MNLIVVVSLLLLHLSDAINSKYIEPKHSYNSNYLYNSKNKQNYIKSQHESNACKIIKSRQRQHLIEYSNSKSKSKIPYEPLYIPESKYC